MSERGATYEVSAELKDRALDAAPVGITISDANRPDNPLIYANKSFEKITGYKRSNILGHNCRFLQGPDTKESSVAELRRGVEEETAVSTEILNYRQDGEKYWNEVTIAPVRDDNGEVTHYVGFQDDITARKEAELTAQRRREHLEHLVSRIETLLHDVTETLMQSNSRQLSEEGVTNRIVQNEPYSIACFAELSRTTDTISPTTCAVSDATASPDIDITGEDAWSIDRDADHPIAGALETESVQVSTDPGVCEEFGETTAAIAVAPLVYNAREYGVLVIGSPTDGAFDGREVVVVDALGRTISAAINANESRRILTTNSVLEVVFDTRDDDLFFVTLSDDCECELEYEGTVYGSDDRPSFFFTTDADPDTLLEMIESSFTDISAALIDESEDRALIEFDLERESVVTTLGEYGAELRSLSTAGGQARLEIDASNVADPRTLVEWFEDSYPDSELVAYRERERPPATKQEFIGRLEDKLTDRQRTALETAYLGGFYDSDRSITGEELAGLLDISRATFHQHLRVAERKVLGEFLEA